jgi:hypothetical protein
MNQDTVVELIIMVAMAIHGHTPAGAAAAERELARIMGS